MTGTMRIAQVVNGFVSWEKSAKTRHIILAPNLVWDKWQTHTGRIEPWQPCSGGCAMQAYVRTHSSHERDFQHRASANVWIAGPAPTHLCGGAPLDAVTSHANDTWRRPHVACHDCTLICACTNMCMHTQVRFPRGKFDVNSSCKLVCFCQCYARLNLH